MRPLPLALAALALAGGAHAQDLFVGSSNTTFWKGDPSLQSSFQAIGACGGQIQSMVEDHGDLFLGDVGGRVYHYDADVGFAGYAFDAPNDAAALVVRGGVLWIGGADGFVHEVDKTDGTPLQSFSVGAPVGALLEHEGFLYAGSTFGVVLRRPVDGGAFAFWGTCGGPVSAIAADDTHLILGDTNGSVYRIALATQQVEGTFLLPSPASALALHDGELLVAAGGELLRVDRVDGSVLGSLAVTSGLEAMALGAAPTPGEPYCFGITGACPCGNPDVLGGCRNHLGAGGRLSTSGTASAAADDLRLVSTELPPNTWGVPYMSALQSAGTPFGDGLLCTGSGYPTFRFPAQNAGAEGAIVLGPGVVDHSQAFAASGGAIAAGSTWAFQLWYRNPAGPCGSGFNTTNGARVTFAP